MIDPTTALRQGLLGLSRHDAVRRVVERVPVSRTVAHRFVAGETTQSAVDRVAQLADDGRLATLHLLAEDTHDVAHASRTRDAYLTLLRALHERDLTAGGAAEISVTLASLGRALPEDGEKIALDNARQLCEAASCVGTTVTIETGDHTTTDCTLDMVRDLRADFPWVGVELQAHLRRSEADCRDLVAAGGRVRLSGGDLGAPGSLAHRTPHEARLAYVRCLKILLAGRQAYPMIATADPRLIEIARSLADKELRAHDSFEFQLPLGVRPQEQARLAGAGHRVRVHVPYGERWSPYVMRRIAADHSNQFLRSVTTKG